MKLSSMPTLSHLTKRQLKHTLKSLRNCCPSLIRHTWSIKTSPTMFLQKSIQMSLKSTLWSNSSTFSFSAILNSHLSHSTAQLNQRIVTLDISMQRKQASRSCLMSTTGLRRILTLIRLWSMLNTLSETKTPPKKCLILSVVILACHSTRASFNGNK